jgi:DNA-binding IclR family transcriptional regulator
MRLFELGSNAISEMNILGIARPYLEELAEITNEVIHLVIPDGHEVVYLFKEDSSNSIVKMSSRIGARDPMYCTGVGKSIMSNLPEEDAHKIWEKSEIIKFTPNTITSFKNMLAEMAKIRKNGFAIDNEEHELGVRCIAVAIKDYAGKPIGAISVAAPISRLDDAKIGLIAPIIKNAANNISNALGKSNFPAQEESTINSHGRGPASRVTGLKNPK